MVEQAEMLLELPPRARRILLDAFPSILKKGTTSACAENTRSNHNYTLSARNYLRVRGEYVTIEALEYLDVELPPRARRIPRNLTQSLLNLRTTSACAENTLPETSVDVTEGNYLRVRGEYFNIIDDTEAGKELPPRARRIHNKTLHRKLRNGTTSACAENTFAATGVH